MRRHTFAHWLWSRCRTLSTRALGSFAVAGLIEISKNLTVCLCVLAVLSGCANGPSTDPGVETPILSGVNEQRRTRNIVFTIGGILLLGAIIANEVGDNVEDAVRDAARP